MSWYHVPEYAALWGLLDQINAEQDAQQMANHPGIASSGQCVKCVSFMADLDSANNQVEILAGTCKQLRNERDNAHRQLQEQQQIIDSLRAEKHRLLCNEQLRMDRPQGFNTANQGD